MTTLPKLRTLYNNPEIGLTGKKAFERNLNTRNIKYKQEHIDQLFQEPALALHRPAPKLFNRRKYYVPGKNHTWGSDLILLPATEMENGYKYFIIVIDLFTRYLWVRPLKDAKSETVTKAFEDIFISAGTHPMFIQTDRGSEYKGSTKKLFEELGLTHYFSNNSTKQPHSERVARTLKNRIKLYQDTHSTHKFIDKLQDIVKGYNNSYHTSIKMTPKEATEGKNQELVYTNLYSKYSESIPSKPKYKEGDIVRTSVDKSIFAKETVWKWSEEKFRIVKVQHTTPPTYKLEDLKGEEIIGSFYEPELQLTSIDEDVQDVTVLKRRTVRKQKQVQVRYADGTEAWIKAEDLMS